MTHDEKTVQMRFVPLPLCFLALAVRDLWVFQPAEPLMVLLEFPPTNTTVQLYSFTFIHLSKVTWIKSQGIYVCVRLWSNPWLLWWATYRNTAVWKLQVRAVDVGSLYPDLIVITQDSLHSYIRQAWRNVRAVLVFTKCAFLLMSTGKLSIKTKKWDISQKVT